MKARRLIAAAVPLLVLFACASEEVKQVDFTFRDTQGGLSGFVCTETRPFSLSSVRPPVLANRLLSGCGGKGKVSIVLDFVRTQGTPRCDSNSLLTWCDVHDCTPLQGSRVCFERDVSKATPGDGVIAAVAAEIKKLSGTLITPRAPGEPVIARVVASRQPCSELADATRAFDCNGLVGCAFSCPILLDGASGAIPLELDLGLGANTGKDGNHALEDSFCALGVGVCARTPLKSANQCAAEVKCPVTIPPRSDK